MTEVLPRGWSRKTLADVSVITMGQSPPGSSYNDVGNGKPFFQGKTEFGNRHPTVRKWTTAGTKFAKAGDILMSVRAPVGPTNIADVDCVIGRGLASIRAIEDIISQDYLIHFLEHVEAVIQSMGKGTTFDAITGNQLRDTEILVPPLDEQLQIVQILEDHLSRLGAAGDDIWKANNFLSVLETSILGQAFSNQGLEGSKLCEVATVTDCEHKTAPKAEGVVYGYSLGTASIRNGALNLEKAKPVSENTFTAWTGRAVPRKGDLVLSREAPVGECALVPASPPVCLGQRTVLIQLNNQIIDSDYLLFRIMSPQVRAWMNGVSTGTTVLHLNVADVRNLPLGKLPTLQNQKQIVEEIRRKIELVHSATNSIVYSKNQLITARRSLLNAAFTGALIKGAHNV